jgi:hypothetical protein
LGEYDEELVRFFLLGGVTEREKDGEGFLPGGYAINLSMGDLAFIGWLFICESLIFVVKLEYASACISFMNSLILSLCYLGLSLDLFKGSSIFKSNESFL